MRKFNSLFLVPVLAAALCPALRAQETAQADINMPPEAADAAPAPAALPPETPAPAAQPAPEAPAPLSSVQPEWEFLRAAAADKDEDVLELVLPQVEDWLLRNPAHGSAGDAQLLKAGLHYRLGDYKSALMDLLRHFYEYPQAPSSEEARKLFQEILDKKVDKKLRPGLLEMAGSAGTGDAADRLADMLRKAPGAAGALLYAPIVAEHRAFLNRFPDRAGNDAVQMAVADMHLNMKEFLPARLAYEKTIALYPASPVIPRAKLFLAVVLADNLKDYEKAIKVFQDITVALPGTDQAWAAYARLPELAEKQDHFQMAVDVYERIIKLYPDKPEAYAAYTAEARVLREELKKPAEAVAVLNRLADKYKDGKAVAALLLAAEICRKDLKDPEGEVRMYDRIAAEFPADQESPKALYAAGEVCEKLLQNDRAAKYYSAVIAKYADNSIAKKAQKRIDAMNGK